MQSQETHQREALNARVDAHARRRFEGRGLVKACRRRCTRNLVLLLLFGIAPSVAPLLPLPPLIGRCQTIGSRRRQPFLLLLLRVTIHHPPLEHAVHRSRHHELVIVREDHVGQPRGRMRKLGHFVLLAIPAGEWEDRDPATVLSHCDPALAAGVGSGGGDDV